MYKGKQIAALIPARAGSKRVPGKNVKLLAGLPLVCHTLFDARESAYIDEIYVSTDCSLVKDFVDYPNTHIINRPKKLCQDNSPTEDTIMHAIKTKLMWSDYIVLLQATCPIREENRIDDAIEMIIEDGYNSIVSCSKIFFLGWKLDGKEAIPLYDINKRPRSQDSDIYKENGSIYVFDTHKFLETKNRLIPPIGMLKMNDLGEDVDIDTMEDFKLAEAMIRIR